MAESGSTLALVALWLQKLRFLIVLSCRVRLSPLTRSAMNSPGLPRNQIRTGVAAAMCDAEKSTGIQPARAPRRLRQSYGRFAGNSSAPDAESISGTGARWREVWRLSRKMIVSLREGPPEYRAKLWRPQRTHENAVLTLHQCHDLQAVDEIDVVLPEEALCFHSTGSKIPISSSM
jgi:hypothetical protein